METVGRIGWTLVVNAWVSWAMAYFCYRAGETQGPYGVTTHRSTASGTWTLAALGLMLLITGLSMVGAANAERARLRSRSTLHQSRPTDVT